MNRVLNTSVICVLVVVSSLSTHIAGQTPNSSHGATKPPVVRYYITMKVMLASPRTVGAETPVGSTYVELLQPLEGPSIFREFIQQRGEGLHHIGYWAMTMEEAENIKDMFRARGVPLLMSAWIDRVFFYYLDSTPMIIEVWTGDLDSLQASGTYP